MLNDEPGDVCYETFAMEFADLMSESHKWFTVEEGHKDLLRASRNRLLYNAGFPASLILRAK